MDDVPDLMALRGERVASDADYIEQLEGLSLGQERENQRLRAALRAVMAETGTSSLAHHYARDALDGSAEAPDFADGWQRRALSAEAERDRLRAVVERAHDHVGQDERALRSLATDDLVALVGVLRRDYALATNAAEAAAEAVGNMAEKCSTLMAERGRLRAVVEAARGVLHLRDTSREVDQPSDWDDESGVQEYARRLARATVATSDALDVMADRLGQLDGSADMGGEPGG